MNKAYWSTSTAVPPTPPLCDPRSSWPISPHVQQVVTTRSVAEEQAKPIIDPDCVFEMSQEELWTQSPALWYGTHPHDAKRSLLCVCSCLVCS